MILSSNAARVVQVAAALTFIGLGALCEWRQRGDPVTALSLAGMVAAGLAAAALSRPIIPTPASEAGKARDKGVDAAILRVCKLMQDHILDAAGYGERLSGASRKLAETQAGEPIDEIVLSLIRNNQDMQAKVVTLTDRLETSRSQIMALQTDLAKAEQFSLNDSLTGIGNRRFFDTALAEEMTAAADERHDLCLAMADLDHFKNVNDRYGHVVGDTFLKIFAEMLTNSLKGQDRIARYGGEEFAALFPRTSLADAAAVAEKIRRQLEAKQWVIGRSGERVGSLTASFGVARLSPGESAASFIQRADAMLYRAKALGRNRVELEQSIDAPLRREDASPAVRRAGSAE